MEDVSLGEVSRSPAGVAGWAALAGPDVSAATGGPAAVQHAATAAASSALAQHSAGVGLGALDALLPTGLAAEDAGAGSKLAGARGAAAMELLRRDLLARPSAWTASMRRNAQVALAGTKDEYDIRTKSLVEFMVRTGAVSRQNRTATYLGIGIARALDMMATGKWELAEATLLLLLSSIEQSNKDNGRWNLAWLMTFQPEPLWAQLVQTMGGDPLRPFGYLADPQLTTAAMAYARDAASLAEVRKKFSEDNNSNKGRGKGDDKDGDKADKDAKKK